MATTEERLAALEAKLAQLTDTRPTTYYMHQYSGEEIDAAVGRALTGGALDTSVGNVSNQLGTFIRPNLLDNWYFGRPVDQKKGMLQLAGTMLYSDAACTQALFPSTKTTSIIKVSDIAAHPSDDSTVYVKLADCVRGYTGNGYMIDRWKGNRDQAITITDNYLNIVKGNDVSSGIMQFFPCETIPNGSTVTLSFLFAPGTQKCRFGLRENTNWGYFAFVDVQTDETHYQLVSVTIPDVTLSTGNFIVWLSFETENPGSVMRPIAAKLELGPTQTLAHQDSAGKWVLNEVPEYGDQLRRCQMDLFKIGDAVRYCSLGNGVARDGQFVSITIPTPITMRTMPVLIAPPVGFTMRHNDTLISGGASFSVDAFSQNSIMLKVQSQVALTPGDMWEAFLPPNGSLVFSAEL